MVNHVKKIWLDVKYHFEMLIGNKNMKLENYWEYFQ